MTSSENVSIGCTSFNDIFSQNVSLYYYKTESLDLLLFKDQKRVIGWVVGIFIEFVKVYVETEN